MYCATRFARLGEPQPVTSSHPVPAGLPAEPVVTSWKSEPYTAGFLPTEYNHGVTSPTVNLPACRSASFQVAVMPAHSGAERLVPPTWSGAPP